MTPCPRVPSYWRSRAVLDLSSVLCMLCYAGLAEKIQVLVDDAVFKGAKLLAGGRIPVGREGYFYPPTVLLGINSRMKIWEEEVFGPVSTARRLYRCIADRLSCAAGHQQPDEGGRSLAP